MSEYLLASLGDLLASPKDLLAPREARPKVREEQHKPREDRPKAREEQPKQREDRPNAPEARPKSTEKCLAFSEEICKLFEFSAKEK